MEVELPDACPFGDCLMADVRGYLKLSHGFPEHPKIEDAGGDAAWLHVCALAYCSRNLSDGFFPVSIVGRLSDRENHKQLASKLLDVGLWHDADKNCDRCPMVPPGKYLIHDYLEHQTSAERAHEISTKRSIAGQKGGQAKAAAKRPPDESPGNLLGNLPSKSVAEVEVEVEVDKQNASSPTAQTRNGVTDALVTHPAKEATVTRIHPDRPDDEPQPLPGFTTAARPRPARADLFDAFWKTYPRKKAKGNAEKAWTKAIDAGTDPEAIIGAALLYAMERKGHDPAYTKYPATWLNQSCWQDEPDPAYTAPAAAPSTAVMPRPNARPVDDFGGDAHMARFLARAEAREATGERGFL